MRAVAVEGNDSLVAASCKVCEHGVKARAEALTRLRHDTHCPYCARKLLNVGHGAHNGNFHMIESLRESYRVVQKASVQLGDRFERKTLGQPGLDRARSGCFGHDD